MGPIDLFHPQLKGFFCVRRSQLEQELNTLKFFPLIPGGEEKEHGHEPKRPRRHCQNGYDGPKNRCTHR